MHVSPSSGFRFVCYCKDCQAFARFLDRTDVLDAAGGTDIFQMAAGRVKLTAGAEALRCLRLSDKVLRWFADCCHTPIGNTAATPRFPMVAVIHPFMDHAGDIHSRDDVLGPPRCSLFDRSAIGPLPSNAPPPPSARIFAQTREDAAELVGARSRPAASIFRRANEGPARCLAC